jgi:hypothetical protein
MDENRDVTSIYFIELLDQLHNPLPPAKQREAKSARTIDSDVSPTIALSFVVVWLWLRTRPGRKVVRIGNLIALLDPL